jgi:hypothetical protein
MRSRRFLAAPAIVFVLAVASAAAAQSPPASPRVACKSSVDTLCHDEAAANDRAAVRACLVKNFDKATPECQAAMKAMQAKMQAKQPDAAPPKP